MLINCHYLWCGRHNENYIYVHCRLQQYCTYREGGKQKWRLSSRTCSSKEDSPGSACQAFFLIFQGLRFLERALTINTVIAERLSTLDIEQEMLAKKEEQVKNTIKKSRALSATSPKPVLNSFHLTWLIVKEIE